MYRMHNKRITSLKQGHFKLIENYHTHDTRQRKKHVVPRTRTKPGQKSSLVTGVKIWNKITDKLKKTAAIKTLKKHINLN